MSVGWGEAYPSPGACTCVGRKV